MSPGKKTKCSEKMAKNFLKCLGIAVEIVAGICSAAAPRSFEAALSALTDVIINFYQTGK